jgi:hypothetical protein
MVFERCIARSALNQGTQAARSRIVSWALAKATRVAKDNVGCLNKPLYRGTKKRRKEGMGWEFESRSCLRVDHEMKNYGLQGWVCDVFPALYIYNITQ